MTRREEIIEEAQRIDHYGMQEQFAFIAGAQWADKTMIEKACEYAEARYDLDYCGNVRDILNYLKSLVEE